MAGNPSDFSTRLAEALQVARQNARAAPAVASAPFATPDEFTKRLQVAAARSRGETVAALADSPAESGTGPEPAAAAEPPAPAAATPELGPVVKVPHPRATEPHTVRDGESITSIAHRYGFYPNTVWENEANAELRAERVKPNVLHPGDIVWIPEKVRKDVPGKQTEQRHRFRRRGCPEKFRLQLQAFGDPRPHESYVIEIDGEVFSGKTDADGWLEQDIPPGARRGKLTVRPGEEYELQLGYLSPVSTDEGVIDRLINLGYLDAADGKDEPKVTAAIEDFQCEHGLDATGDADQPTRNKLVELYGC